MILSVENGCYGYKREILKNVNFSAESGEVLAVLGPNGAGKTTLLKCIIGFLKWKSGKSMLDGEDISKIPQRELWKKIAYVPQAKSAVYSYSVREFVLLGRSSHIDIFSKPSEKDKKIAENAMKRLGIEFLSEKKCSEISGGEMQMVLIAKALASEAELLILDEPESNLDFKNQLLVLDTISKLARDGTACIFNTHYPAHALRRADKAILLGKNGEMLFGTTASVVTEKNIERAFGVKTVISEVETRKKVVKDIIPLSQSENDGKLLYENSESAAVISIITNGKAAEDVNTVLHDYRGYVVGRMGMPYRKYGINVINVILDAPSDILESITRRLNLLDGVSVKTVYAAD